jgi:hypothetical protein
MNDAMRRLEGLVGERIVMRVRPHRIDLRADASDDDGGTWRKDLDYIFERVRDAN